MITRNEFIKALRTNKPFYAYVKWTDDDGGYMQQVKSDWIKALKEMDERTIFNANVNEKSIYLN